MFFITGIRRDLDELEMFEDVDNKLSQELKESFNEKIHKTEVTEEFYRGNLTAKESKRNYRG